MSDATVSSRESHDADDHLLSADDVAEMIGMTRDYVYDLSRRGRIPTITFGRRRRYRREAVVKWIEDLEDRTVR